MTDRIKSTLKVVASLAVAGAFLWAAFKEVDWSAFFQTIGDADPFWLVVSCLLFFVVNLARAWRWRILIAPIARGVSLRQAFIAVFIGYAGNNVLPRAGEVIWRQGYCAVKKAYGMRSSRRRTSPPEYTSAQVSGMMRVDMS